MAKKIFKRFKKKSREKELSGYAFVGFFFLGMAVGAFYGRWDVGPFLGLALGFIATLIVMIKY
ncbi:MAG: hypothetical protein JSV92_01380 [archaeon]|nr:MAG: hypothetical protein JSV92_01380 [archaeon]